jgi:hypothetical protein
VVDHRRVVAPNREVVGVLEQIREVLAVRVVHACLLGVSEIGRRVVGPFHQPHCSRQIDQPAEVVGRPPHVRLNADAHLRVVGDVRLEGVERRVDGRVVLHVDPDEEIVGRRDRDDLSEVLAERLLAHVESELARLDRHAAVETSVSKLL